MYQQYRKIVFQFFRDKGESLESIPVKAIANNILQILSQFDRIGKNVILLYWAIRDYLCVLRLYLSYQVQSCPSVCVSV